MKIYLRSISIIIFLGVFSAVIFAQTTEFTYQGSLKDGAAAANGNYDFEFRLFDAATGGSQHPTVVTRTNVAVANGTFSVKLDFFSPLIEAFPGADRFLEIRVRNSGTSIYVPLDPRQKIGGTPYSQKSLNAENSVNATNSAQLGGIAASQYVTLANGGATFIQNSSSVQSNSNFNISGNGIVGGFFSAGTLTATNGFNIGANRVLSVAGLLNTIVGVNSGAVNTGTNNAFLGTSAGATNSTGGGNSFFGSNSGSTNTTGGNNSFFGRLAGSSNISGSNNTIIGAGANVSGNNRSFATAIGAGATVSADNTIVLGRSNDKVFIPGNINVAGNLFVGFGGLNSLSGTFNDIIVQRLTSANNTAGVFIDDDATIAGDLVVDGTITENGNRPSRGISRNTIDNPLDPNNKTLTLSSIQSLDLVNIYSGNAPTDANGEVVVTMPDYVAALNKDFCYQLTVVGTFAQAIVAEEITQNSFKIKTDKPNVKVSWQVTGVRKDAAAEKSRVPVEQTKTDKEKEEIRSSQTTKQPDETPRKEN